MADKTGEMGGKSNVCVHVLPSCLIVVCRFSFVSCRKQKPALTPLSNSDFSMGLEAWKAVPTSAGEIGISRTEPNTHYLQMTNLHGGATAVMQTARWRTTGRSSALVESECRVLSGTCVPRIFIEVIDERNENEKKKLYGVVQEITQEGNSTSEWQKLNSPLQVTYAGDFEIRLFLYADGEGTLVWKSATIGAH